MSLIVETKIIQIMKEEKIIKTKELMEKLNLSNSTLRRYLLNLERKNIIKRVFGEIIYRDDDKFLEDRLAQETIDVNVEAKKNIAQAAAKLAASYKNVYIDSGSSCFYLLDFLNRDIEIYTNSIINAKKAIDLNFQKVNIIGGQIKSNTMAIVNIEKDFIEKVNFSIAFMGVNGISDDERFTTPEKQEGIVKKQISEKAQLIVFLCEKQKLGVKTFYDFTPNNKRIIIVTDYEKSKNKSKYTYIKANK